MEEYIIYKDDEELGIKPTYKTPFVWLMRSGELTITGRSIPEDGYWFYMDIDDWILDYCKDPAPTTHLFISLEYLNDISAKLLLRYIQHLNRSGTVLRVVWNYCSYDSDMLELGIFMRDISSARFEFIENES